MNIIAVSSLMNKERDGSVSKKDRCRFFMHEGVKRPPSHSTIRNLSYFRGYRGEIFTIKFCSSGQLEAVIYV